MYLNPCRSPPPTDTTHAPAQLDRGCAESEMRAAARFRCTTREISSRYMWSAAVITVGLEESLLSDRDRNVDQGSLRSVGAPIPARGSDDVIRARSVTRWRRPVAIVKPRPDTPVDEQRRAFAGQRGLGLSILVARDDRDRKALHHSCNSLGPASRATYLASLAAQACVGSMVVVAESGLRATRAGGVVGRRSPRDPVAAAAILRGLNDHSVGEEMPHSARLCSHRSKRQQSAAEIGQGVREASRLRGRGAAGGAQHTVKLCLSSRVFAHLDASCDVAAAA
jgi:hypothetical protein